MSTDGHDDDGRASTLDLSPTELEELSRAFNRLVFEYLSEPRLLPVFPATSAEKLKGLFGAGLPGDVRPQLEDEEQQEETNARLDRLNERVMHRVQRGGEAYISNAVLRGRFALRASITNYRTTRGDIDLTLDAIRRAAREVVED